MTPILRRSLLTAASLSTLLTATAAFAQEDNASTGVEELIVTAQKRDEKALDVPIALSAFGSDRLEALGVQDFATLSQFTPGFTVQDQSPNNPGFVIRGITSDSTDSFSGSRVSVFQDGVSISKSQGSYVELFDLARVEVAKGPQSTLYGRGALIGAVNIIEKKADPSGLEGYAKAQVGNDNFRLAEGAVNLPFSDTFAVRIAGVLRQRDGYVKNALGGDDFQSLDSRAFRASLNWTPNDRFKADLIFNYQQDSPTGTAFKSGGYSPTDPVTGQVLAGREPWEPATLAAADGFQGGRPLGLERLVRGVTGLASYDITDSLTLSSITAYRRFESKETFDPDGTSLPILTGLNDARHEQWSQELRLNYDNGGRIHGFVGAGWYKEEDVQRLPLQFDERIGLAVLTGQLNAGAAGSGLPATTPAPLAYFGNTAFTGALVRGLVANLSGNSIVLTLAQAQAIAANLRANETEEATNDSQLEAVDLFGDITFDVTDKLSISAGLRYSHDDKTTGFSSRTIGGRSVLGGAIGAGNLAGQAKALIASGDPVKVAQGNAMMAQANAILGALQSPNVQQIPTSLLPNFGLTYQPTANNGDRASVSDDDGAFTWRLVAKYALSGDANVYASYARGRRPEVLATSGPAQPYAAARFQNIEAETVDSYEIGAKAALLDRRLRLDGSVYYYDYDNFQTVEQQGTLFVITNAGKAKAYGFEGQAELHVVTGLNLYATYAYSHARFEGGAYDGNSFRLSPDHTLSLAASWRFQGLGGTFDLRPSYTWRSKAFFDDNNDLAKFQQPPAVFVADNVQDEFQKAYGLLNLRVSYEPQGLPVKVEAFVNNITDENYIIDAGNTGDSLGLPTFIAGPPRLFGVGLTWKFGG